MVHDLTIELVDRPGALAEMGQALGAAGSASRAVGCSARGGRGLAHFLFEDGARRRRGAARGGITVLAHP